MPLPARRPAWVLLVCALFAWSAACGITPSSPSAPPVTDTLTGVLSPTNLNAHQFSASAGGDVTITLVTLTPPVTAVGMGIGAVSNGSCSIQFTNSPFVAGEVWQTSLAASGTYCIAIYDIGYLTQNENYSITVVHP